MSAADHRNTSAVSAVVNGWAAKDPKLTGAAAILAAAAKGQTDPTALRAAARAAKGGNA